MELLSTDLGRTLGLAHDRTRLATISSNLLDLTQFQNMPLHFLNLSSYDELDLLIRCSQPEEYAD